jgi:hypothetical protein
MLEVLLLNSFILQTGRVLKILGVYLETSEVFNDDPLEIIAIIHK